MVVCSPTFLDRTGYFPEMNLKTTFQGFNEGLLNVRADLGEALFKEFVQMSDQMRACFEADPEDVTGETRRGKNIARKMEVMLGTYRLTLDPGRWRPADED
jgi:hypothetical protein